MQSCTQQQQWRLLVDGDLAGARNMARDTAILEHLAAAGGKPTLRLYGWQPACLSLGRHQRIEAADLRFCRRQGIDVVRRPTGGRAVLHHLELTYAVVAPLARPLPQRLQEVYTLLCRPLVRACRSLGIAAELSGGEITTLGRGNQALPGPSSNDPCFQAPASGEVVVGGRKLIGSAMRSHHGCILQHGAILLDWDGELQAGSMGLVDDRQLRPLITTFTEQLGTIPPRTTLETAIIAAFAAELEIDLVPGVLDGAELHLEQQLEPESCLQLTQSC